MRWILFVLLALNVPPLVFAVESPETGGRDGVPDGAGVLHGGDALRERQGSAGGDAQAHCFAVGPLVSSLQASKLESAMNAGGIAARKVEKEVESGWDYWVYIPPPPSARATARLLEELSSSGIESFLIADGELEGAIAMGVFPDEDGALERHLWLSNLGYDTRIYHMQRWAREYWLLAEQIPDERRWRQVLQEFPRGIVQEKIYPRACKTVASPRRIP